MMGRYVGVTRRWGSLLASFVMVGLAIQWIFASRMEERVKGAVENVLNCKSDLVPDALRNLKPFSKDAVKLECRARQSLDGTSGDNSSNT